MKIGERVDHQLTITAKAVDEGKRILKFSITDETSDRSNDVIEARGGDMENYLKNPVVLVRLLIAKANMPRQRLRKVQQLELIQLLFADMI